jgi:hypothetical protein
MEMHRETLRPRPGGPGELTLKSRAADVISGKILKELDAEARQLLLLLAHSSRLRMSYLVMYAAKENVMLCAVYIILRTHTHTHI